MTKKLGLYFIVFAGLFLMTKNLHVHFLLRNEIYLRFGLLGVYRYHAVFSFVVCASFAFLAAQKKWSNQLGVFYLAVLVVKIGLFIGLFYRPIISLDKLTTAESISLMVPVAVFLIFEVFFLARILNPK